MTSKANDIGECLTQINIHFSLLRKKEILLSPSSSLIQSNLPVEHLRVSHQARRRVSPVKSDRRRMTKIGRVIIKCQIDRITADPLTSISSLVFLFWSIWFIDHRLTQSNAQVYGRANEEDGGEIIFLIDQKNADRYWLKKMMHIRSNRLKMNGKRREKRGASRGSRLRCWWLSLTSEVRANEKETGTTNLQCPCWACGCCRLLDVKICRQRCPKRIKLRRRCDLPSFSEFIDQNERNVCRM